jgi:hypothetical protein
MFDAHVFGDDRFRCLISASGEWYVGVQVVPDHVPPEWPDGAFQQVHLDLHVEDSRDAHEEASGLVPGCSSRATSTPASAIRCTPTRQATRFCIGCGHPSREAVPAFVANQLSAENR